MIIHESLWLTVVIVESGLCILIFFLMLETSNYSIFTITKNHLHGKVRVFFWIMYFFQRFKYAKFLREKTVWSVKGIKKPRLCPRHIGQLIGVWPCASKGGGFSSQSGHSVGLLVWSLVETQTGGNWSIFLFLSLSPSLHHSLKSIKTYP